MINKKRIELNKAEKAAAKQSPKRVSRKTLRRRRMIKRLIGILAVIIVTAAAIFAAMKMLFVVRTVDISGSNIFTTKEISDFVNIPMEENIFKIDAGAIEVSLVEEFTYIDSARVIKRLPDRVDITVEDSIECYYAADADRYAVYSQSFKKLRNCDQPPQGAVWLNVDMNSEEQLSVAKNMLELFEKYGLDKITAVSVTADGTIGANYDDRFEIEFGTVLDIDYKIKMCKKVLDEKIPAGERGTIDATEGGEIVYKRQ